MKCFTSNINYFYEIFYSDIIVFLLQLYLIIEHKIRKLPPLPYFISHFLCLNLLPGKRWPIGRYLKFFAFFKYEINPILTVPSCM